MLTSVHVCRKTDHHWCLHQDLSFLLCLWVMSHPICGHPFITAYTCICLNGMPSALNLICIFFVNLCRLFRSSSKFNDSWLCPLSKRSWCWKLSDILLTKMLDSMGSKHCVLWNSTDNWLPHWQRTVSFRSLPSGFVVFHEPWPWWVVRSVVPRRMPWHKDHVDMGCCG